MAGKAKNRIIIAIGVLGALVLVVAIVALMVSSAISEFSSPDEGDKKLVFSVAQKSENVLEDINTLEQVKEAYEKGEQRMQQEAVEAERVRSLSSTSFASGAFRATNTNVREEAPPEPKRSDDVAVAQPKPAPKPKPKPKPQAADTVVVAASVQADGQAVRRKRTSFDEPMATAQAQQPMGGSSVKFRARIFEDVSITSSSNVRVRVLEDFTYNGCTVKRNTLLPAVAQRGNNVVTMSIQSMVACGNRMVVNINGYSLDGTLGLPVREDNAAETGVREGGNAAISGAAGSVATRATGVLGIVGSAVASGVSSGTRASQQAKPVLLEEGRELLFIGG